MRFELHDTNRMTRYIVAPTTVNELRVYLAEFKTECATDGKAYEYNHFVNWLKKYQNISIEYEGSTVQRVDM